jgi:hypothetical protein
MWQDLARRRSFAAALEKNFFCKGSDNTLVCKDHYVHCMSQMPGTKHGRPRTLHKKSIHSSNNYIFFLILVSASLLSMLWN